MHGTKTICEQEDSDVWWLNGGREARGSSPRHGQIAKGCILQAVLLFQLFGQLTCQERWSGRKQVTCTYKQTVRDQGKKGYSDSLRRERRAVPTYKSLDHSGKWLLPISRCCTTYWEMQRTHQIARLLQQHWACAEIAWQKKKQNNYFLNPLYLIITH